MFSWLKSLRLSLPIATGASAIIATALLISWTHDKDKLKKDESDEILKDLEKTAEEFKDETITKPDEDQQSEKELDKKESEDGKDETNEEQKTTKDEELDAEGRKKVVEQLITDATQIKIGDKTLRTDEQAKTLQLPDADGSPSAEKPLEETNVPAPAETEARGPEGPAEPHGIPEVQEPKEEGPELLEKGDPSAKENEMKTPIQEEEGEAVIPESQDHPEKAQDAEVSASEATTENEENEKVKGDDGEEQSAAKGENQNQKEENSGTEKPSGKEAGWENAEEGKRDSRDNSPEGDSDGSEHGNDDTNAWDIDKLTGLLRELDGQKNSLSAKLASLLSRN